MWLLEWYDVSNTTMVFGTDSTHTNCMDKWHHHRVRRNANREVLHLFIYSFIYLSGQLLSGGMNLKTDLRSSVSKKQNRCIICITGSDKSRNNCILYRFMPSSESFIFLSRFWGEFRSSLASWRMLFKWKSMGKTPGTASNAGDLIRSIAFGATQPLFFSRLMSPSKRTRASRMTY